MRTKLYLFLFGILTIIPVVLTAQEDPKRMAVLNIDLTEWSQDRSVFNELVLGDLQALQQNTLSSIPEHLVRAYSDMKRFVMIDRINYHLIADERERQKSEDFIDGYTWLKVAQGKSEGIDYLLTSKYFATDNTINVSLFDVASGVVTCQAIVEVARSRTGDKATSYYVSQLLDELNECFDIRYPVVKILTSKKEKAKTVLVAAGSKHQMRRNRLVEFFLNTEIEVDGKMIPRQEVVGNGVVIEVDGKNFSIVEIEEGRQEIYKLIHENSKLYCRTANW